MTTRTPASISPRGQNDFSQYQSRLIHVLNMPIWLTHGLESFRISYGTEQGGLSCKKSSDKETHIYATRWWNRDLPMLSACSLSSRCKLLGSWPASLIFCPTKRIADMQNGDRWRRLKGSHNFASAALPKPSLSQSKKNGIDAYLSQESLEGSKTGMKECAPRKNLY